MTLRVPGLIPAKALGDLLDGGLESAVVNQAVGSGSLTSALLRKTNLKSEIALCPKVIFAPTNTNFPGRTHGDGSGFFEGLRNLR